MHDVGTIVIIDDREKCNNSIYELAFGGCFAR